MSKKYSRILKKITPFTQTNKLNFQKGFTLVEVMVATVVLAIGVVIIFEVFLLSIDTANFFDDRMNAQWFLNEKLWQVQNSLNQPGGVFVPMHERGMVNLGRKVCKWETHLLTKDAAQELYLLRATLKWEQGNKQRSVTRQTLVKRYFNNSVL